MKNYYQLIPRKVLNAWSDLVGMMQDIPGFSEDYLKQIISIIAYRIRKDGPSPLMMKYLRKVVPHAELYLKRLMEFGVINRQSYKVGSTAFRYSFTEMFDSDFVALKLTNAYLIRRIESKQRDIKRHDGRKYAAQNKFIRALRLDGDLFATIEENCNDDLGKYNYAFAAAIR